MKRLYTLGFCIALFLMTVYLSAFRYEAAKTLNYNKQVTENYKVGFDNLLSAVQRLNEQSKALVDSKKSIQKLQGAFEACRASYKRIEFLMEFMDAGAVKLYINGAPLPSLAKDTDAMEVKKPQGLQTLEELIFSENPFQEKASITDLTKKIAGHLSKLRVFHHRFEIKDAQVFHAARLQMIRILSLGLTGFDTPATANAIPEAEISLSAVHDAIKAFYNQLAEQPGNLDQSLEKAFVGGISYLQKNRDFEGFDRLYFLKNHLNPIFKQLKLARKSLSLPSYNRMQPKGLKVGFNDNVDNIFDQNLINPYLYTSLTERDHSSKSIQLGKMLFFDPILSKNNDRSCASCHKPELAFTDGEKKSIATGFDGTVQRNSPTLMNAIYSKRFFYDLRTDNFERQVEHVIFNTQEFDMTTIKIMERLQKSEEYMQLFNEAIPSVAGRPSLNAYSFAAAISSYVASLRSFNSPFDQYVRGEIDQIDEDVKKGFNVFMGKGGCATCHFAPTFNGTIPPLFDDSESEVLGVPENKDVNTPIIDKDPGRAMGMMKERVGIYHRSFKTVTVRNIEMTAPYMHNGVYDSLEEVVDFYNRGGGAGMGLDVPNQTLPPDPLDLTDDEQKALVAFMKSLTDYERFNTVPKRLPAFPEESGLNARKIGGEY